MSMYRFHYTRKLTEKELKRLKKEHPIAYIAYIASDIFGLLISFIGSIIIGLMITIFFILIFKLSRVLIR